MIAHSSLDAESVNILRDYANELLVYVSTFYSMAFWFFSVCAETYVVSLRYMVKEKDRIFLREYESTAMAYQNVSRS